MKPKFIIRWKPVSVSHDGEVFYDQPGMIPLNVEAVTLIMGILARRVDYFVVKVFNSELPQHHDDQPVLSCLIYNPVNHA